MLRKFVHSIASERVRRGRSNSVELVGRFGGRERHRRWISARDRWTSRADETASKAQDPKINQPRERRPRDFKNTQHAHLASEGQESSHAGASASRGSGQKRGLDVVDVFAVAKFHLHQAERTSIRCRCSRVYRIRRNQSARSLAVGQLTTF